MIGAGAAGLAVAARLAARRHRVTVLEQSDRVGGKLATVRHAGFAFDTGPSLFTLPAVYRDLFLKTGRPLEEEVDLQPVEPGFRYEFGDGSRAVLPGVGAGAFAAALGDQLGGRTADEWRSLMVRAGAMWRLTREPVLQSPLRGPRSLVPLARRPGDIATIAPWQSLRTLGRRTLRDPRARTLLDRYATYSGSDPRRAPAVLATIPYVEQTFGIWHIGGGLGALADAMHRRCAALGVEIRTGTVVTGIEVRADRVAGVRTTTDAAIPADIVISDADAHHLYADLLGTSLHPRVRRARQRVRRTEPSLSGFVLLLGLSGRTPGAVHHTVSFPTDYDGEFDDVFGRRGHPARPPRDPALYICNPEDPAMRPDDAHESWFVLVNAPRHSDPRLPTGGSIDWRAPGVATGYRDHVLALLTRRGLLEPARITWQQTITPADIAERTGSPGGAIYGTASHGAGAAFLRPANEGAIGGLYLVGGSAHPGGGLPLVGMSAEITAGLIGPARRPARRAAP